MLLGFCTSSVIVDALRQGLSHCVNTTTTMNAHYYTRINVRAIHDSEDQLPYNLAAELEIAASRSRSQVLATSAAS